MTVNRGKCTNEKRLPMGHILSKECVVPTNPLENTIIMESLSFRTGVPAKNGDQNLSSSKTLPRTETFEITLRFRD